MKGVITVGLLAASLLPVWKSGTRRGMTFWDFVIGHTVFSPWPSLYVPEEYATRTSINKRDD